MRFWTTDWSYNDFFNRLGSSRKFAPRIAESFEKRAKKDARPHTKFIGNSSGVGTNAGLHAHSCAAREGQTRRTRRGRKDNKSILCMGGSGRREEQDVRYCACRKGRRRGGA